MPSSITLNLLQGVVEFHFSPDAARDLQRALTELVNRLKVTATQQTTGAQRTPAASLTYQHTGDIFLEVFCNPNIWPSPFAAKLLITVRDQQIRLTTEAELPRILEDISYYLEASEA